MKKILGIIISFFFLNLTAADTSADEELANRLYEVSRTFKNSLEDTTGKTKDFTQKEKAVVLNFYRDEDEEGKKIENPRFEEYLNTGILDIIRNAAPGKIAAELNNQDVQDATKQHLHAIDDQNMRGQAAIDLLKAANFLYIKPIMQAAAQSVADYLKTNEMLEAFNKDPEEFIDILPDELQEKVSAQLLKPYFLLAQTAPLQEIVLSNLAYRPGGEQIASSSPYEVRSWKSQTGNLIFSEAFNEKIKIAYSPNGTHLAVATAISVFLLNPETGATLRELSSGLNSEVLRDFAYSADGNLLALLSGSSIANDDIVTIWNTRKQAQAPWQIRLGERFSIHTIALSPNSKQLAITVFDGRDEKASIQLWDTNTKERIHTFDGINVNTILVYRPDGEQLAVVSSGHVEFRSPKTGELITSFHNTCNDSDAYSPTSTSYRSDSKQFAIAKGKIISLLDPDTSKIMHRLESHSRPVQAIAYRPNSNEIASGDNATVKVWNSNTGTLKYEIPTEFMYYIAYSSDGEQLAIYDDETIKFYTLHQFSKDITLPQALYIYYKLAHPNLLVASNAKAQQNFKELYDSLPNVIQRLIPAEEKQVPMTHWPSNEAESSEMATEKQSEELSQTQKERLREAKEYQNPTEESIEEWMAMYDEDEPEERKRKREEEEPCAPAIKRTRTDDESDEESDGEAMEL